MTPVDNKKNKVIEMWKNAEQDTADDEVTNSGEEINENRKLGSNTAPVTEEVDVGADPEFDRNTEANPDIKSSIAVNQEKNMSRVEDRLENDSANQDEERKPSHGSENLFDEESDHNAEYYKINPTDTYELEKYKTNAMIIFQHEIFDDGNLCFFFAMKDNNTLAQTFESFNFNVETHIDLNRNELFRTLKMFSLKDFTQCGCVCIAIFTDSRGNTLLRASDMFYEEREVGEYFNVENNPTLRGKPIIFLIQSYKTQDIIESVIIDPNGPYNLPVGSEMLIFHSRHIIHPEFGTNLEVSFFRDTLCDAIIRLAEYESFDFICSKVMRKIALEQENYVPNLMPTLTSTLRKRLYLRKYGSKGVPLEPYFLSRLSMMRKRINQNVPNAIALKIRANTPKARHFEKQCIPDINASTYQLENFSKNYMIIFNHEHFLDDYTRKGTALDESTLRDTFEGFRFDVTTHDDLDKTRLFRELKKFSRQDFTGCGCICVAILTHGIDNGYLSAFDKWYSERKIFACFDALVNPTLVAKPIIFLIQACRGSRLAPSVPVRQPHPRAEIELDYSVKRECRRSLPSESDMIIIHSCVIGRASARVPDEGSWFIQTLCEQIKLRAGTEHFEKINRRVRKIIALEKELNDSKQVPVATSTLLRKLFFKANEDLKTEKGTFLE